ncbi:PIG-L family deacetylase [Catellatospora bangladeshensis]|uniref:PIG-L family deacetylase n=1 Tax=Catellatospora bangladeshensis TaxID=310355 RepID=A0A8J3JUX9_9ACTN|nr:PIG-L family deacetylase [Catellatospora bangladeshensis]GIF85590.1 hypothetical protein Cba03nite_69390 [Catellatospora bangladeshensis]
MSTSSAAELGTVLGVWAHPDDEVYLSGGLMALAADAGNRVVCVTATAGEHGTADPDRWPPDRLAAVRTHELRASLAVLGVTEHRFLGLPDGACADQPARPVVSRLAALIGEVRPDTIVTFAPDGFTGHGDHRAVSRWTTAARALAAPGARLLHTAVTQEFLDRWQAVYERLDIFVGGLPVRTPRDRLSLHLSLSPAPADRKLVALRAQATQTAGLVAVLGEDTMRDWCAEESFIDADEVAGSTPTSAWPAPRDLAEPVTAQLRHGAATGRS